jgi:hypothetical protein
MSTVSYKRIGELLVARGNLTEDQLQEALQWRFRTKERFGQVLVDLGFVKESDVVEALSEQFDQPIVDVEKVTPEASALQLIDQKFAIEHTCLPISLDEMGLHVALSDPLDMATIDELAAKAKVRVEVFLAAPSAIKRTINRAYESLSTPTRKRHTKRQADRDSLLELLSSVEPWSPDLELREAA